MDALFSKYLITLNLLKLGTDRCKDMSLCGSTFSGQKYFTWDDTNNCLFLLGASKQENERTDMNHRQPRKRTKKLHIFCPHAYLKMTFDETVDPSDQLRFRKEYLRKVPLSQPDVVIIQDIKNLILFLAVENISVNFIRLFHVPVVDRFLRALIIYFQYYIEIWEILRQKQTVAEKKAPNPREISEHIRLTNHMKNLRSMVAREYLDILIGANDTLVYHHMNDNGQSTDEPTSQSQGEKELRIYETLLQMSHRVVWIALRRKYGNLIEVEMNRLFRMDAFNTVRNRGADSTAPDMFDDEMRILHGEPMPTKRKYLKNSPLFNEIIRTNCDHRILLLGLVRVKSHDPRCRYLENAPLADETELSRLRIKVGILGEPRSNYDVMFNPIEKQNHSEKQNGIAVEEKKWVEECSLIATDPQHEKIKLYEVPEVLTIPSFGDDLELLAECLIELVDTNKRGHHKIREEACTKWIARAMKRYASNNIDTTSLVTE